MGGWAVSTSASVSVSPRRSLFNICAPFEYYRASDRLLHMNDFTLYDAVGRDRVLKVKNTLYLELATTERSWNQFYIPRLFCTEDIILIYESTSIDSVIVTHDNLINSWACILNNILRAGANHPILSSLCNVTSVSV